MESLLVPWRSGASRLLAGEAPSPLDLIGLTFAFTQTPLLTPAEFIKTAADRGVEISYQQLQVLFRRQLLVPLFAVHPRRVRPPRELDFGADRWTDRHLLVNRARQGRVSDAAAKPHPRWPAEAWQAPYLYSEYQLLALRMLGPLIAAMPRTLGSDGVVRWRLGIPADLQVAACCRMRDLAIVLEVLSTRYRSAVLRRVTNGNDSMWAYLNDHDRREEERLLTLPPDRFVAQADHLLFHAGSFDPMGSWHRVVRIGSPAHWHELRNEALLAMDYRIAAELLLLHYEDLVKHEVAAPLEPASGFHKPHGDRLAVDFRERGETVMDFELSQRPLVVLALEGPTEITFAQALLKHFKVEEKSDLIQLVNLRSIDRDIRLLAHTAAVPRIDPNGYVGARVLHPLTALVVAVDPENKYATPALCAQRKAEMIDEIIQSVDQSVDLKALRSELEIIVQVRTWSRWTFEYEHFTDRELAQAVRRLVKGAAPPLPELQAMIRTKREYQQNIEKVWARWTVKPAKPDIARELIPTMIRKVDRGKVVPLVEAINEAILLGQRTRGIREVAVRG